MNYYLDCEFNSYRGQLISLALVSEKGKSLYLIYPLHEGIDPWVKTHVLPILDTGAVIGERVTPVQGAHLIADFLKDDVAPNIIADWPIDFAHFAEAVLTGPGTMADIDTYTTQLLRVDAYPTNLRDAVQHNAWWDAIALRHLHQKSKAMHPDLIA